MKSANNRIFLGFLILILAFSISEYVSYTNLEKSREINDRNAQVFQPSIIYLNELGLLISDAEDYTESWVFFDIIDHPDKNALREMHQVGLNHLTQKVVNISKSWENEKDEKRLRTIINTLDSIMIEQNYIMEKLEKLEDYAKENLIDLIAVEDVHLVRVKQLSATAKEDLMALTARMKERSLEEKDAAQESFNSIQTVHIILAGLVLIICLIVAWYILRFFKSEQQKKVITEERDEIKIQKAIIEEKNTEILSSISYAKRLQTSLLPSTEDIAKNFSDHFIFYKPRDIVSGDFYWFREITVEGRNLMLIAAADATGHGVPGAFVSFVCYSSLNRAVDEFGLTQPCKILDKVSEIVSDTFSSTDTVTEVSDGMDVSLCVFDLDARKLYFSGAHNSAYVLREGEMNKLVATRKAVGRSIVDTCFTKEVWNLQQGDIVYLFSDGFQDQFGGKKGKKYQIRRFLKFLTEMGQQQTLSAQQLEQEFEQWKGHEEQIDDVLVIGLKV